MTAALVIPAAGIGSRFSSDVKKQFLDIDGKPLLYYTLLNMMKAYDFDEIIIGLTPSDIAYATEMIETLNLGIQVSYIDGGDTRADTVMNCIKTSSSDIIVVHDAVRPFISSNIVTDVIKTAIDNGCAICGLQATDTIKYVENGKIVKTVPRDNVYMAHTPQAFKRGLLLEALSSALSKGIAITDEASVMELAGYSVSVITSSKDNIKITTHEDMASVTVLKDKYF